MMTKRIWLVLVIFIAIFVRVWKLDQVELFGDELDAGFQAYSILKTGRDYRGHSWPLYMKGLCEWRAPLLMYTMVPFVAVFGLNEWGVRLTVAGWGLINLVFFYLLLKEFKVKKNVRLAAVGLLAVLPWHIQYSRTAFELTVMAGLIMAGLWLLKRGKDVAAAILLGLSVYAYNTANILVPLLAIALIYTDNKKRFWRLVRLGGMIAVVTAPMLWLIASGHAGDRFRLISVFSADEIVRQINTFRNWDGSMIIKLFHNRVAYWPVKILRNYGHALSTDFLFGEGDVTFRHSFHRMGNLYWIMLPILIWGIKKIEKKDRFWLAFLLLSPIPAALTIDGAYHSSRLFMLMFPLVYFAAKGLVSIVKWRKTALMLVGLILTIEFANFQIYYWRLYPRESWRWWHWGYKEIMSEVAKEEGNYDRVLIDNTYEPGLIRYWFWTRKQPNERLFAQDDKMMTKEVDGFDGFCYEKACFVNFGDNFGPEMIEEGKLYLISQIRNVDGDWDWEKSPPEGIRVLETSRNPLGEPLFYLVSRDSF